MAITKRTGLSMKFSCEIALHPEHIMSDISSRRAGDCEECDERVISLLQEKNTHSLSSVHHSEKALGFEERFDADLESNDILKLLSDKEKLEKRQDHLVKRVLSSGDVVWDSLPRPSMDAFSHH